VKRENTEVKLLRGKKDFTMCYAYLFIAIQNAVVSMWILRHDYSLKKSLENFYMHYFIDSNNTTPAFSVHIDVLYFTTIFVALLIVDAVSLGHFSLSVWSFIYTVLIHHFGPSVFVPVFCMHLEYLIQKYKYGEKANLKDQLLFTIICGLLCGLCYLVVLHFPSEYLTTYSGGAFSNEAQRWINEIEIETARKEKEEKEREEFWRETERKQRLEREKAREEEVSWEKAKERRQFEFA